MNTKTNFKNLIIYIIIIFLILSFLMLSGCNGEKKRTFEEWEKIEEARIAAIKEDVQYKGKVLEIISDAEEELKDGSATRTQVLKVRITNGPFKDEIIEVKNSSDARSAYNITIVRAVKQHVNA